MSTTTTEVAGVADVEVIDLASAAIGSGSAAGTGNQLYNAVPGTGAAFQTTPAQASPDVKSPTLFDVFTSFTAIVVTSAARIRVSQDGTNYLDWIDLPVGVWEITLIGKKVQVSRENDANTGTYQLVFFL